MEVAGDGREHRTVPTWARRAVVCGSCALFLLIIFVRGGPNPAETDAHADTLAATAISHGDLSAAERATLVPNPPGYPLLTAPFVLVLRPWVGAPRWCDDKPVPPTLRSGPGSAFYRAIFAPCGAPATPPSRPLWYRSQALLTVLGFAVLAVGAILLMRAAGAGRGWRECVLVVALALLPATTDAVAQTFHPQDLMSVGFAFMGIAQALRRRWLMVGIAFGVAFVCKQFALLPLIGVLAAAPTWRARLLCVLPAAGVIGVVVLPFYIVDPADTVHALSAVYVAGVTVVKTTTVLGQLGIGEQAKLEIARDGPLACTVVLAYLCRRLRGPRLLETEALLGLVVACFAVRLVFEVGLLDYYFLAVGAALLALDICCARVPVRTIGWVVATRFGLTWVAAHASPMLTAWLYLGLALVPVAMGLACVLRGRDPVTGTGPTALRPATGS